MTSNQQEARTMASGLRAHDVVWAVIAKGVYRGTYVGRVAIKSDGYVKIIMPAIAGRCTA